MDTENPSKIIPASVLLPASSSASSPRVVP